MLFAQQPPQLQIVIAAAHLAQLLPFEAARSLRNLFQ
jgi:hypothetical protein